ncbi:fatty acid-binding protein, heart [Aplysia californica]|uniref:Fatty acid-binding protein, heart n=1 Tax=Aplysia californica TaxID=6500 RepID=A0ABM0JN71_APLCA|nr:fatty acid-binding protein, heart [Aplysia californica]
MEPFLGTWKVVIEKTSGVLELGKLFGWEEGKAEMVSKLEYTMLLEANGDTLRAFLDYGNPKLEFNFKLGEEFDYTGPDGSKAKCKVLMEGGKWVEYYRVPEKPEATWTTTRELNGGEMLATTLFDAAPDVKCNQTLVKA